MITQFSTPYCGSNSHRQIIVADTIGIAQTSTRQTDGITRAHAEHLHQQGCQQEARSPSARATQATLTTSVRSSVNQKSLSPSTRVKLSRPTNGASPVNSDRGPKSCSRQR